MPARGPEVVRTRAPDAVLDISQLADLVPEERRRSTACAGRASALGVSVQGILSTDQVQHDGARLFTHASAGRRDIARALGHQDRLGLPGQEEPPPRQCVMEAGYRLQAP